MIFASNFNLIFFSKNTAYLLLLVDACCKEEENDDVSEKVRPQRVQGRCWQARSGANSPARKMNNS